MLQLRNAGAWVPVPTDRLHYVRVGAKWKPILDIWVRDLGAWRKETSYSAPGLSTPTNLRMNPADGNNRSSIPVAWDWNQGAGPPDGDWVVILADEANNWVQAYALPSGTRTYTFTNLTQNKRYKVLVVVRYPGESTLPNGTGPKGRDDVWFPGAIQWYLGRDPYGVQDVVVNGWLGEQEFRFHPGYLLNASTESVGWPGIYTVDNNIGGNSRWVSDVMPEPLDATQGEGLRILFPQGHYLLNGCRVWPAYNHTIWWSAHQNGAWAGGLNVYNGKHPIYVHPYLQGLNYPQDGHDGVLDFRGGQWVTDATNDGSFDLLVQRPVNVGSGPRVSIWEVAALVQPWGQTGWGWRMEPAVNSGYW